MPKTIVIASNNVKKIEEFKAIFSDLPQIRLVPQSEYHVPDVEETGLTFVENAILKARQACLSTSLPAIADDSGLEIDALKGAPGIYSARYGKTDEERISRVLNELNHVPTEKRTARFRTTIVYLRHEQDPAPFIASGSFEGRILQKPEGPVRFTYEPIFYVESHQCTVAQMSLEEKNRIGHRGLALKQLHQFFVHLLQHTR